ncbi:hypothetical protein R50072_05320 [Simiduia litorea]|uniref:hypothetical protein n=1 Tax=Simiduia litorea TaxID=1435348 RepID=UPI0036F30142
MAKKNKLFLFVLFGVVLLGGYFSIKAKRYHADSWIYNYAYESVVSIFDDKKQVRHIIFYLVDHFEPGSDAAAVKNTSLWLARYTKAVENIYDDYGSRFQYTWFYPYDHKNEDVLRQLATMSKNGFGEVELHWHHGHTTSESFANDLDQALEWFSSFGLLRAQGDSDSKFSFIHGNWALDNSGLQKHCGVNDEISILKSRGGYADFTFSTHSVSQPAYINRIVRVKDDPLKPRSYENAIDTEVGLKNDDFLLFLGPSGFNFRRLQFEVGALESDTSYTTERLRIWISNAPSVKGAEEVKFIKVHTHGITAEENLLNENGIAKIAEDLSLFAKESGYKVHYMTSRQVYNVVRAIESGMDGDPDLYKDYEVKRPAVQSMKTSD